ncbi:iron reductase [Lactiplantibacillus pentosus]|uniref:iron reductase n=1 Tax=Lactiplantibacillus pentosus TaxID=1589 RepID=UPI0022E16CA7|nr:iron reductase [Lactiplantibacillus pentosus]
MAAMIGGKLMLKRYPVALYAVWLVILIVIPLPLIWSLDVQLLDTSRNLLIYDAGAVAYTWWLTIVALSVRPRWLDRLIGLPAMYFVHGLVGVLALILATVHVQLAFTMHDIIRITGRWAWYLAIFGILYAMFFMSGWIVDRLVPVQRLKNKLQFFFKHQLSVWIHRLNFVMIGLIWLHVHVIPRVNALHSFILVFDLYTVVALGLYAWHKFIVSASESRKGKLIANQMINARVRQLTVELTGAVNMFRPGDFYFLSFPAVKGLSKEAHPFSVTTVPNKAHTVVFTIQTSGDFTENLGLASPGDPVRLEGPFGRFDKILSHDDPQQPLILYGMGTGLAPLLSLADAYASVRPVHLFWTVRPGDAQIFDQQFETLLARHPQIKLNRHVHRFEPKDLQRLLSKKEIQSGRFVVVGNASGVLQIEKTFVALGVGRSRLTDERLTM